MVVTVLDAGGVPLSNSVPVMVTVESGPGLFPTGPQIPFDPATPIAIRDGRAAIEFRSHEAGRTVLRATSPGLVDATLTLTTIETVPLPARRRKAAPVRLRAPENTAAAVGGDADLALNHPTRASSEKPGHPASNANGGDPATTWLADDDQVPAWWQVDLERFDTVTRVSILLPGEGDYRYRIELSGDGHTWKPGVDRSQGTNRDASRTETFPAGLTGRFLRITFTGLPPQTPAGLCGMTVYGTAAATP